MKLNKADSSLQNYKVATNLQIEFVCVTSKKVNTIYKIPDFRNPTSKNLLSVMLVHM
jgi:hypothetical protein